MSSFDLVPGDSHKCSIFCLRCNTSIGPQYPIHQLLKIAPLVILAHNVCLPKWSQFPKEAKENKSVHEEHLWYVCPLLFSSYKAYLDAEQEYNRWKQLDPGNDILDCVENIGGFDLEKSSVDDAIAYHLSFADACKTEGQFTSQSCYGDSDSWAGQCHYTRMFCFVFFESPSFGEVFLRDNSNGTTTPNKDWKNWARSKIGRYLLPSAPELVECKEDILQEEHCGAIQYKAWNHAINRHLIGKIIHGTIKIDEKYNMATIKKVISST